MPLKYLHELKEFKELLQITAQEQDIAEPTLVEKDYWIMHVLHSLSQQDFVFQLKGGTSLSKAYQIIHRFSEDIDIRMEPPKIKKVYTGVHQNKPAHVQSRSEYFDWLSENISIPGVSKVARDHAFDDTKFRNGGIRLFYESQFVAIPGLKEGILLELGFDQTTPNQALDISSWAYDRATKSFIKLKDNRAKRIFCYNPEYSFVEKLQTVASKFRQFEREGKLRPNLLRHYYDIYQLLDRPEIQGFIGTKAYLEHKKARFKSLSLNLRDTDAFTLKAPDTYELFEKQYLRTKNLYYRDFPELSAILERIGRYLDKL